MVNFLYEQIGGIRVDRVDRVIISSSSSTNAIIFQAAHMSCKSGNIILIGVISLGISTVVL